MHRFARRAVLVSVVLLEYLVLAGLFFAAAFWAARSGSVYDEGAVYLGWLIYVIGLVLVPTGFVIAVVALTISERRSARRGMASGDGAWAVIGQATRAAGWGGLGAIVLSPITVCVGAHVLPVISG